MDKTNIMLNIVREQNKSDETLEQLAQRVSEACQEEQKRRQKNYFLIDEPASATVELDEIKEEDLKQIVTHAAQASKPEKDSEFLIAIPDLHHSWFALKVINKNPRLQEIYAMIMLALYEGQIPLEAETRILCLDDVDGFAQTLNKCGQEWSRRAKTIMRTQHKSLYDKLFEARHIYFSFID